MPYSIRLLNPDVDFSRLAELYTLVSTQKYTADMLHEYESTAPASRIRRRIAAVDANDTLIACGDALREPWMPGHRFAIDINVFPEYRNQGIGAHLYDEAVAFARAGGCDFLIGSVREDSAEGMRFVTKRHYGFARHIFESCLPLAGFDEARFIPALEKAKESGIRFSSLAETGDQDEKILRSLHTLNAALVADEPANAGVGNSFSSFEDFQKIVFRSSWYRPDGQIFALDGDRWVGMAAVGIFTETNSAYNMITGVDREYRGRGIAQALKLLAVRFALHHGVDYIRTNNDSANEVMLAINRKFGYVPEPGLFWIGRPIDDSAPETP